MVDKWRESRKEGLGSKLGECAEDLQTDFFVDDSVVQREGQPGIRYKQETFTERSLWTEHCSKHFTSISSVSQFLLETDTRTTAK